MTHYKLIVYGDSNDGPIVWGTEFDSLKAARQAAEWFITHNFHTTIVTDQEDEAA